MLERMKPRRYNLHIGLLARDDWVWIDGSPLNPSLWMPGNPTSYKEIQGCAVLSAGSSRIKNENCGLTFFPLCQKKPDSLSNLSLTQGSSVRLPYSPSLAIDRSYTTCFRSLKESNPWWQVTLKKPLYVTSVEIIDKIDCCPRDSGMINITVSTSQTGLDSTCTGSLQYGKAQDYKVHCSPPARGTYVTVMLTGDNVTLVLCHVVLRTIESVGDAHGVLREVWYGVNYDSTKTSTMRENPAFRHPVESQIIVRDFDAPVNMDNNYIQRLTSYLQVPESGKYTFYLSCDDLCELWKHDVSVIEEKDMNAEEIVTEQPIVTVKRYTWYRQWNRYPEQMSQSIFLDKCRVYQMEAFMWEGRGHDHISVGMRKPSGEYERPIPGTRLFWTKPGTRTLEVTLQDRKTLLSVIVGSQLHISGHFAYIDDPYKAQLKSPLLPWKPLYQSLGLCLRFKYLMPAKSRPTLKVFLRESNGENPLLVWRLDGYHGEEWSEAQVPLADIKGFQVKANRN
ncbi:uncharacterized protein LOC144645495 [Oculina patagonica]